MQSYDHPYDLTDEQLLRYSALPAIAKLRWLDQARRFTLQGRAARAKAWRVEDPGAVKEGE